MLRTYYYKNLFSHVCNQVLGYLILLGYGYLNYTGLTGFKLQYDILHNENDALSFAILFLVLALFLIQATKSYLLYFPSTYLIFDGKGISFNKFKREFQYIDWQEINLIRLEIENEWMLNIFIEKSDGEVIRLVLSEKWLLSFSRKLCIKHNFLKLMSIAKNNPILMKKLDSDEVQDFYEYCGILK